MASSRWALRAAATVTALAFALPFSSGTANADPILVLLQDNHVNATIGVSGNVDMLDVAAGAHVSIDTGPGISVMTNGGIQVALGLCAHADVGVGVGVGVGAVIGAHVDAAVAADAQVAADVSATDDRTPAPAVQAVVETVAEPVAETVAEPAVAAAPAETAEAVTTEAVTTEAVAEDKTNTSVHIGGISVNVGPYAAAMLDAHADVQVGVNSDLANINASAGVAADASVDLGSGDVGASAYIGIGLTIG
jgi:hypothetical protein